MSVIVYVWKNSPADVGHVSLLVKDTYISFWPKSAAKAKNDIKLGQTHEAAFPSSYKVDRRLEQKDSDNKIMLKRLDEELMIDYWNDFKDNQKRYNMLNSNCSTVVASLLEIGSGLPPLKTPSIRINDYVNNKYMRWLLKLRFFGNYIHMWSPNDVMMYALQIRSSKTP